MNDLLMKEIFYQQIVMPSRYFLRKLNVLPKEKVEFTCVPVISLGARSSAAASCPTRFTYFSNAEPRTALNACTRIPWQTARIIIYEFAQSSMVNEIREFCLVTRITRFLNTYLRTITLDLIKSSSH